MAGLLDSIKRNWTGGDIYDKRAKQLHKRFIGELNKMAEYEGYVSRLSSMDMKYNFSLQKQRLEKHRLTMKREYTLPEDAFFGVSMMMGGDKRYITRIPTVQCQCERTLASDHKTLQKNKTKETIYSYTVFVENQNKDASYCCPNCGDVNSVRQLLEQGCRSCRTKFMMFDLYPRITNFYTIRDKSYVRTKPLPFVLLGMLAALLVFFFVTSKGMAIGFEYFFAMVMSPVAGGMLGYLLYVCVVGLLLLMDSVKSSHLYSFYKKTRKNLPPFMQKFDPYFSIDFFVGKVNNLLKTLVFIEHYDNCSVYEQGGDNPYPDIVDVEYQGIIGLNDMSSDERYVYVDVDVYAKTTYLRNNKLKQKDEVFRMALCRGIGVRDDCDASIHNIQCQSCGASFDAVRERNCPYCRNPYHLQNYDWVVTDFERR